ncbi:MAG: bifunctional diaminohydroxyphosphoribosylaminopyrimidine deaminase/5-amino-6-(5-phosphoribosylamino)uracil reductase RibD [Proteobacteria bacterium]|nr:bifunctional diaminohydroxyphosphoribosylaminopyrimidine deaminase/5-amino-6-(5-phosphoribosylamino)uracil reductase RibD [Pseudomonadota bacterium]
MNMNYQYLSEALELAKQRKGFCAPNPAVGAVIVKNNQVLARGTHWAAGKPHAEIEALNQLTADEMQGATLYVTLEPCCHHGKTPPCTDAIIKSGIKEVFYGYQDPHSIVAGKGAQQLKAAGIACHHESHEGIDNFYKSYTFWQMHKRPYVTAKLAFSLDGKIAGPNYQSVKITGKELDNFTHDCRKHSDAILTTAKTIIQDDPQLNVRLNNEIIKKPIYILDRELRLSQNFKIYDTAESVTVFYEQSCALPHAIEHKIEYVAMPVQNDQLNVTEILNYLGEKGIHDLWVEAGGVLLETLLKEKLFQKLLIYVSPKVLGESAISGFHQSHDWAKSAKKINWKVFGEDVLCEFEF